MKTFLSVPVLALCLSFPAAFAQKWEIGVVGAGSFYNSQSVTNAAGKADATFDKGYGGGFLLGQNMYRYIGGELRYTFLVNDMQLKSGGTKVNFGAQSHVMHYDFLFHMAPTGAKVRPFASVGAGVKYYRGTGTEVVAQPLSSFALLTKTNEVKGMFTFGAGVKVQISKRAKLRVEVRDYVTPFPKDVIAPNRGSSVSGWLHNIVPMVGVSYDF